MSISNRTRKILWGKAARFCSICRENLVEEGIGESDRSSIIGDEAHIVSGKESGPRYESDFPEELIDTYPNLILLCKKHHKIIDDHEDEYPSGKLREIKKRHESWVISNLGGIAETKGIILVEEKAPSHLIRIEHGSGFKVILGGAYAMEHTKEELTSREEVDAVGELMSILEDFDVIFDSSGGLKLQTELEFELARLLGELDSLGLWVFGSKKTNVYNMNGELHEWPVGIIHIYRKSNPEIFKMDLSAEGGAPDPPG